MNKVQVYVVRLNGKAIGYAQSMHGANIIASRKPGAVVTAGLVSADGTRRKFRIAE